MATESLFFNSKSHASYMKDCCTKVNQSLSLIMRSQSHVSSRLMEAIHYTVLNGGKRIRPSMAIAACIAVGGTAEQAIPAACSVELIHTYSLIHDDLPSMDDDDLRRGKPSCHKMFDEAIAILAGDALQSLAFETLSNKKLCPAPHLDDATRVQLISILSQSVGVSGMVGGQALDSDAIGTSLKPEELERMHDCKTGALISASVTMGALSAKNDKHKISDNQLQQLNTFTQAIGLAFQIQDDIIDVTSDTETLGKPQGADREKDKPTSVSVLGLEMARTYAQELHQKAINAVNIFDESADHLRNIAHHIIQRSS